MDIETIRVARREMERKIHIAVADAMDEFHKMTGFSPHKIEMNLVDATVLRDKEKRYSVIEVLATVEL